MTRRSTILQCLRVEARATLHVLLLLLLVPILHPVAEARAVQNGTAGIICSTFGVPSPDAADRAGLPDDAPDCLACAMVAAAVPPIVSALAPVQFIQRAPLPPVANANVRQILVPSAAPRGPPIIS
jgi:hypothetical protein